MVASDGFSAGPILPPLHMPAEITISRLGRHFSSRETVRAVFGRSVVADKYLTIKQKSTLPVGKTRQDKSLFCSLPGTYPPPQTRPADPLCPTSTEGASGFCQTIPPSGRQLMSIGASEHRASVRAKARFAGQKAQEHSFVRGNAVFTGHIAMYRWRHFRQSRL